MFISDKVDRGEPAHTETCLSAHGLAGFVPFGDIQKLPVRAVFKNEIT